MKNFNLEDLRQQISIVEVINNFIKLTKKGNNYVGLCPFHDDHHASLTVNETKKIFKCFSCNIAGDAFTFIKNFEHSSYQQAIIKACKITNHEELLNDTLKKQLDKVSENDHYYSLNAKANEFFRMFLNNKESKKAMDYLVNQRHFTNDIINKFEIGFSPENKQIMIQLLTNHDNVLKNDNVFSFDDIKNVGLATINQAAEFESYFFNRITFPIYDQYNNLVGFSARAISNDNEPKYLNSPSTAIFNKSKILYNLNKLIDKDLESIYILEGFMDVIALDKINVYNAIATMGVALTKDHVAILKQFSQLKSVVLAFDNDIAGKEALKKAASLLINDFDVYVINYTTEHKDFDELVNYDTSLATETINNTIHYDSYLINEIISKIDQAKNEMNKNNLINEAIAILKKIKNDFVLAQNINKLCTSLNIDSEIIKQALSLNKPSSKNTSRYTNKKLQVNQAIILKDYKSKKTPKIDPIENTEKEIIKCCLYDVKYHELFLKNDNTWEINKYKLLANIIDNIYFNNQDITSFIKCDEKISNLINDNFNSVQAQEINFFINDINTKQTRFSQEKVLSIINTHKKYVLNKAKMKLHSKFKENLIDEKAYYEALDNINKKIKQLANK